MKTVCHITLYPEQYKLYTKKSGVSSYAKNLISNIHDNNKHIVIADKDWSPISYQEDDVQVERVWDKWLICIIQIMKKVISIKPDILHLQHEMSLFGLIGGYSLIILLRSYTWICWSKLIITSHSVVAKSEITRKFLDDNNQKRPVRFAKLWFHILYWIITKSDTLIVHELIFKRRLKDEYWLSVSRVSLIAHGIDSFVRLEKQKARQEISERIQQDLWNKKLLFTMGYVAGYKDIELLIRWFAEYCKNHDDRFLVLWAGIHPKLASDTVYMEKYNSYRALAEDSIPSGQYSWVWFVDDKDIPSYYSGADLTIYPYKVALASSGPMAISIWYHTPFVASECFAPYFEEYPALIFESNISGIVDVLTRDLSGIQWTIDTLYNERVWDKVSKKTSALYG